MQTNTAEQVWVLSLPARLHATHMLLTGSDEVLLKLLGGTREGGVSLLQGLGNSTGLSIAGEERTNNTSVLLAGLCLNL